MLIKTKYQTVAVGPGGLPVGNPCQFISLLGEEISDGGALLLI